jgi:hypothetical protein
MKIENEKIKQTILDLQKKNDKRRYVKRRNDNRNKLEASQIFCFKGPCQLLISKMSI